MLRCGSYFECYLDEFYYFFNIYNITTEKVKLPNEVAGSENVEFPGRRYSHFLFQAR